MKGLKLLLVLLIISTALNLTKKKKHSKTHHKHKTGKTRIITKTLPND